MFQYFFGLTQDFLVNYGVLAVFLIGIIEELFFILPSSLMFLAVGFFMMDPQLSIWQAIFFITVKIAIWGALGIALASFAIYGLAYWGGKAFINKYGRYFGINWADIERVEKKFSSGWADEALIFFFRAVPIFPITVVSVFCGLIRIPWKTFGVYTFLGAAPRVAVLAFVGWQLGEAYQNFGYTLLAIEKYAAIALIISIILSAFYYYLYKKRS